MWGKRKTPGEGDEFDIHLGGSRGGRGRGPGGGGRGVIFWNRLGTSEISVAGWLAMIFGVIITLALGIGLMTLMYISNRRGYDEGSRRDC